MGNTLNTLLSLVNTPNPLLLLVRCEVFSSLLVKAGVKNVFQLEDGVLGYGAGSVEDTRHWEGNLFVFDDR